MGLRAIIGGVAQEPLQPQQSAPISNNQANNVPSQSGQPTPEQANAVLHRVAQQDRVPSEFEQDIQRISPNVSDTYDFGVRVTFPKPPEQMTYNDYTKAYLRAMFRSQGLSDVTDDEIAMFQARLGRAVGDNFGLNHAANREAMAERYREVQRTNGDEVVWATNERGRAYVDAGMRDIFRERQARAERMEQNRQQAQHESTQMLLDSGRVMVNSAINLGNVTLQFLSMQPEHVPGLRTEDGERVPNPAVPQIPRLEYQSEMFQRDGRTIEVGTTLGLALLSVPRSAPSPQTLNLGRAEAVTTEAAGASRVSASLRVPQGFTEEQFAQFSARVREGAGRFGSDIRVHGSRAAGTAREGSDIDIAIRVTPERFNQILREQFRNTRPGSAAERTMQHAIETGKIHRRPLRLSDLGEQLKRDFGREVDISVIREGGPFDQGPWIPLR